MHWTWRRDVGSAHRRIFMINWIYIFFGVLGALMGLNVWLMLRNCKVGRFRLELVSRISEAAQTDIQRWPLRMWRWRYAVFPQVSSDRLLSPFWKPRPGPAC